MTRPHSIARLSGLMIALLAGCAAPTPKPSDQAQRPEPPVVQRPPPVPVTPPPVATPESTPEPTPQPPPPLPPAEPAPKPPPVVEPPPPPSVTLHPRRPVDTWAIFREAERDELDAACEARWTGGRRLEIKTDNVRRLTLDLTRLPPDAPRQGPWNVQIDGQGVEITGFTPKPGYTGKVRDLVRSPNGNWTVDKKRLYRGGL